MLCPAGRPAPVCLDLTQEHRFFPQSPCVIIRELQLRSLTTAIASSAPGRSAHSSLHQIKQVSPAGLPGKLRNRSPSHYCYLAGLSCLPWWPDAILYLHTPTEPYILIQLQSSHLPERLLFFSHEKQKWVISAKHQQKCWELGSIPFLDIGPQGAHA